MPLITVKSGTVPPGTHIATLVGVAPKRMVTQYSKNGEEQDFLEWSWLVDSAEGEPTELRSLTTTATGPKSRIFEYLVALFGADKVQVGMGFEENDLVGKRVLLSVVLNDEGFSKIDRVVSAPKEAPKAVPTAPTAPTASAADAGVVVPAGTPEDDLPF